MTLLMTASCESGNKEFGYDGETAVYFANAGYVPGGSLGCAISEAVEVATTHEGYRYVLGSVLNQVLPVSYTHLDVYKRQRPFCAAA